MTNTQLYLAIGLPCFLVLLNLIINLSAIKDLRSEMRDLRSDMNAGFSEVKGRLSTIEADLRQFYSITASTTGA